MYAMTGCPIYRNSTHFDCQLQSKGHIMEERDDFWELKLSIRSDNLEGSLLIIKDAVKSIWPPNVRIIRDFIDHGIAHSDRVAHHITKLLKILKLDASKDLSEIEMYLLLLGVYLHDIGMQCDVVKFPQIKKIAEDLNADFKDINFNADGSNNGSSNYSQEQQIAIRDNHQYLTAAWIKYAYDNRDPYQHSMLDDALKSIPELLVTDLMDICKYHSALPIDTAFGECKQDREVNKTLVAALLRFADELDVDRDRVSPGVYKYFRLPPGSSKFWWLHERTGVNLDVETRKVTLKVYLHPDDIGPYGSSIREFCIDKFQKKNLPLLKVLKTHGIQISIS